MIAAPYTRLLVARDQVNQAAALLITSVGLASTLGIPENKWVFLHGYAHAEEREIERPADLGVALSAQLATRAALDAAGLGPGHISFFDFYSPFPLAVFNVHEALALNPADPPALPATSA